MDSVSTKLPIEKVIPLQLPVINFGGHINVIGGARNNNLILTDENSNVLGVIEDNKFYGSHKYGLTMTNLINIIAIMKKPNDMSQNSV